MERNEFDSLEIEANGIASVPRFKADGEVVTTKESVADIIAYELRDAEKGHNYGLGSFQVPFIRRR